MVIVPELSLHGLLFCEENLRHVYSLTSLLSWKCGYTFEYKNYSKEEGLDYTLQEKLNDKNVKHPNLFVTGSLPYNIAKYDFIFLDSVNRLCLTAEDFVY